MGDLQHHYTKKDFLTSFLFRGVSTFLTTPVTPTKANIKKLKLKKTYLKDILPLVSQAQKNLLCQSQLMELIKGVFKFVVLFLIGFCCVKFAFHIESGHEMQHWPDMG